MAGENRLQEAKQLIQQGKTQAAREILVTLQDDPEARLWLWRLDQKAQRRFSLFKRKPASAPPSAFENAEGEGRNWADARALLNILALVAAGIVVALILYLNFADQRDRENEIARVQQTSMAVSTYRVMTLNASTESAMTPMGGGSSLADAITATVTDVLDVDTIEVKIDGVTQQVRYVGIIGPEATSRCHDTALAFNANLVRNKTVRLVKDIVETDLSGALLRYVYVNDVLVNSFLLGAGYAIPATYTLSSAYADVFQQAAIRAQRGRAGCYATGGFGTDRVFIAPTDSPTTAFCNKTLCNQFDSRALLESYLNQCPQDHFKFDHDGDGIPCSTAGDW
jgi:micrococcal nuclease